MKATKTGLRALQKLCSTDVNSKYSHILFDVGNQILIATDGKVLGIVNNSNEQEFVFDPTKWKLSALHKLNIDRILNSADIDDWIDVESISARTISAPEIKDFVTSALSNVFSTPNQIDICLNGCMPFSTIDIVKCESFIQEAASLKDEQRVVPVMTVNKVNDNIMLSMYHIGTSIGEPILRKTVTNVFAFAINDTCTSKYMYIEGKLIKL